MFVIVHSLLPVHWPNASDCHTLSHDAWGQTYLHITFTASKCSSNTLELRSGIWQQAGRISCLRFNGNTTCLASSCVHWTNLSTLRCETTNNKLSVDGTNKTNIQAFHVDLSWFQYRSHRHHVTIQITPEARGAILHNRRRKTKQIHSWEPRTHNFRASRR